MVRLWNVADGTQLAEFAGHHFRVVAVRFSPSARYLVSLGSQEDNTVYVWDRASGQRVASAKVTNKINGVAFSPTGHFFVTVGVRHVRYWYLEPRRNRHKETLPLNGRNAVLGDLLNNTFTDVCCTLRVPNAVSTYKDRSSDYSSTAMTATTTTEDGVAGTVLTLVVSKAGQLMQFSDQRYLEKWVELRTSKASCISTSGPWLVVGCARGTCLLFESETLQFLAQLPLPHTLGSDLQSDVPCKQPSAPPPQTTAPSSDDTETPSHPDLLAIKLDWSRSRVICCYTDHSFYVWDISDLNNIRRRLSHFYHSRGVWSIDCFVETPPNLSPSMSSAQFGDSHYSVKDSATWPFRGWTKREAFVTMLQMGWILSEF
ncbi:Mitogen-activated protein kinase-binding protein 1 [Fasciola gigantica]|uniref:Mitogen-activated protein kinase-binding protein 1 n=1 Tax=Fasciola gigantica TaxID=46835 RepID=A0A504YJ23_FASGI|nr:Mitogen-activated protein kinase-binding protein 1 [Fasciola gigantica]